MYRLFVAAVLACVAILPSGFVTCARAEEDQSSQSETTAIRAAASKYLKAIQQGDLDAMRATWTADGDYVDIAGQLSKPHGLIGKSHAAAPPEAAASDSSSMRSSLRFITPDVAIEDGMSGDQAGRFTAVWVKRDGRWLLDSLRESVSQSAPSNPRLLPLAWLLGEWIGLNDESATLVSSHWSDNGKFIVRDFAIRGANGESVIGTQRIGWDPLTKKIKSWSFDSQGGAGEGYWRQEGEKWIVDSTEVTGEGKQARTSVVYAPQDANRFIWEVRNANVEDEKLPALSIEFKRATEDE